MKLTAKCFCLLAVSLLLFSCREKRRNVIRVDAAEVKVIVPVVRLDSLLFSHSSSLVDMQAWHSAMLGSDPFYKTYLEKIMNIRADSQAPSYLMQFCNTREWRNLQSDIDSTYPDLSAVTSSFTEVFSKLSILLPREQTPRIYYFNSGFNVGIWPDSTLLGVGLEWYLHPENRLVNLLPPENFPRYKRENMRREFLVPDGVKGWLLFNLLRNENTATLLDYMVFNGKVMYALDAVLPEVADSTKMNYSAAQMEWCRVHEARIWKEFVRQNLVYSTKERDLMRFTMEGPFTNGFGQESSPKLGVYLGWQMVADYMDKHPDTSLSDLFDKIPAQQILKAYKPPR